MNGRLISQTTPSLLSLRAINKQFGAIRALSGVSLSVEAGSIHALVGENGAGKSTLIAVLAGLVRADAGEIWWRGEALAAHSPSQARARGIAVLYQVPRLFGALTVAENLLCERAGFWVRGRAMVRPARELLARFEVDLDPEQTADELSLAQQQLVALVRAWNQGASLLVFDEPTAVLPKREADLLLQRLERLREQGTAVLYVSHRLDEVFAISDRISVLRDGKCVHSGPTRELGRDALIQHMVGQSAVAISRKSNSPSGQPILKVEGLSTKVGRVRDIHFELHSGQVLAVAGLVGAGRSELLRALVGLNQLTQGRVLLDGRNVCPRSPRQALALGLAYVPEDRRRFGQIGPFSVRENLSLPQLGRFTRLGILDLVRERNFANEQRAQYSIKCDSTEVPLSQLSGGNQQKVILARWLACSPRVLLLDEPTQGIDVAGRAEIHRLIQRETARGMAVLMASSDWNEIRELADRVLVLHEGRSRALLAPDTPPEILLAHALGQDVH